MKAQDLLLSLNWAIKSNFTLIEMFIGETYFESDDSREVHKLLIDAYSCSLYATQVHG